MLYVLVALFTQLIFIFELKVLKYIKLGIVKLIDFKTIVVKHFLKKPIV